MKCLLLLLAGTVALMAADISGKWTGTVKGDPEAQGQIAELNLKQTGAEITGTAGAGGGESWPIQNGKFEDDRVTFDITAEEIPVHFELRLENDHLKGTVTYQEGGQKHTVALDLYRRAN
jgi:hypothetical protein